MAIYFCPLIFCFMLLYFLFLRWPCILFLEQKSGDGHKQINYQCQNSLFDFLFLHPLDLSHEQSRGYLGISLLRTHCLSCELTSLELRTQSQPVYKNTSPQCHTLRWVRKSIKLYFTNKTNSYNMRWEAALIFLRPNILLQVI